MTPAIGIDRSSPYREDIDLSPFRSARSSSTVVQSEYTSQHHKPKSTSERPGSRNPAPPVHTPTIELEEGRRRGFALNGGTLNR